ncbi:MAG: hypothetical protein JJU29_05370 [Verrucomicrobia bacterium]|nr:hypothetical protein [Verrucomicrobiota bacterium]MCH8511781.1 hypothetical protein [Kiritimatiellia bacterium]
MKRLILLSLLTACLPLFAQLPSETLLIVNGSSPEAMTVANHYIDLRGIPAERVLVLEPPESYFRDENGGTRWRTNADRTMRIVVEPLRAKLEALNDPFPTALIFSPDWPTRIGLGDGNFVSLTAFAGTLGNLPDPERIKNGQAISPWFTAPDQRARGMRLARYPATDLNEAGLHPAMVLGVFYDPLDTEAIIAALKRSAGADHAAPKGSVAIVTNTDVRTRARLPQMELAAERLARRNIPLHMETRDVPLPDTLIGAMEGAASVPVQRRYAGKLVPGSFAEHLTSFAGTFHNDSQTKMTQWIAAGAAGTVGTVDEPMSIWTKFPLVEIFERYAMGNTLLEALMQSIGSPYHSLPMGDPLCRPWGREFSAVRLETEWQENTLVIRTPGLRPSSANEFHLHVDGTRIPGTGPEWRWEADPETTGPAVDVLLHARKTWAPPETAMRRKIVKTPFSEILKFSEGDAHINGRFLLESERDMVVWEIYQGQRQIFRESQSGKTLRATVPVSVTGEGPAIYQARGITREGRRVRSAPLQISR